MSRSDRMTNPQETFNDNIYFNIWLFSVNESTFHAQEKATFANINKYFKACASFPQ